jgi:hypothetical protein
VKKFEANQPTGYYLYYFRWFIFRSFTEIFSGSAYKNLQKLGEALAQAFVKASRS